MHGTRDKAQLSVLYQTTVASLTLVHSYLHHFSITYSKVEIMSKNHIAGLLLALSVVVGTGAANAEAVITDYIHGSINSDGSIVDRSGKVVGHVSSGGGAVLKTEVVKPAPIEVNPPAGTIITKTIETPGSVSIEKNITGGVTMSDVLAETIIDRRERLARDLEAARSRIDAARMAELEARLNGVVTVDRLASLRSDLTYEQALAMARSLDDIAMPVSTVTEMKYVPLIFTDPTTSTKRITVTESVMKRIH